MAEKMKSELSLEQLNKIPMFFIVGRPRTGSTLLRTLFDAHPNVLIPPEWPMLLLLHIQFGKIKNWDSEKLQEFYEALFNPMRIKYWSIRNWPEIDMVKLHAKIMQCEGEYSLETLIKVVYCHFNSFFDKKEILFFGDKNPATSIYTDLLAKIFPTAKFIHLVRDYRDNISSMLGVDFEMPNVALLAYRWKYLYKGIEKSAQKFPERFYTIRYEDFVANPELHFSHLCSFLGIPHNAEILKFYTHKAEIENSYPPEIINRYFSSLMQPIDTRKVGIYKEKLNSKQVYTAELVAGKIGKLAGYKPTNSEFACIDYLKVLPVVLYTKGLYLIGKIVKILPFSWMLWIINKPSFVVKVYSKLKSSR